MYVNLLNSLFGVMLRQSKIQGSNVRILFFGGLRQDMTEYLRDLLTTHTHLFVLITGLYEVNVIPTEDSDRLELAGNYLMTVRKEYLCLHSAKTGERVFQWELDHLPRFRLQRLSHLQDLDKVLTFQAAR